MLRFVVLAVFVATAAASDFVSSSYYDEPIPYFYSNPQVTYYNPSLYYGPQDQFQYQFHQSESLQQQKPLSGIVRITSGNIPSNVQGNITFRQINPNEVQVEGTIIGMSPGQYGFHIHEKGDLTNGCLSAGAHFNPYKKTHGAPDAAARHVGDLGNVEFGSDLIARINFVDRQISLQGERSILGRAVVLHSGKDDLGLTNHPDSLTTGNAGGRAACGVIGILDPVAWNSATSRAVSVMAIVSSAVLALAVAY